MLLLYAIAAGVIAGLFARGHVGALADVRMRAWPLAVGALFFQVALFSPPVASIVAGYGPPLYVVSTAVVLVALATNLHLPGFRLIALGALLNTAVILANAGHMPAAPEAFAIAHGVSALPTTLYSNSTLIGPDTWLPWLGDVFALPRGVPLANVFSVGDVLIGVGGGLFVFRTMRAGRTAGDAQAPVEVSALPSS
jgi:hypothetical protein